MKVIRSTARKYEEFPINPFKFNRFGQLSTVFFAALILGCASVPQFQPSQPLNQAGSLQEGLLLCNEYRLPAEPKRPVTLRPFLDCVDTSRDQFPAAANGNAEFTTFRNEFHRLYGFLTDSSWSENLGTELDIAIHAAFRGLWQEQRPTVTPLERELLMKNFPETAHKLGVVRWNVSTKASLDPHLEILKAGMAALATGEGGGSSSVSNQGVASSVNTSDLCSRFLRLRGEVLYLGNLWQDQYDLTLLAPQSPISVSVREKYAAGLNAAVHDLEKLRSEVAVARAKGSFHVLACG